MKYRSAALLCIMHCALCIKAIDPPTFSEPHGYKTKAFALELQAEEGAAIYYTTDCSTPSAQNGTLYTAPISVSGNTIVRAVAIDAEGEASATSTSTYLYIEDVLRQSNTPAGYPTMWGPYASIQGTAIADYEMDPDMTRNKATTDSITRGLLSLPVISLVTDRGNLFSDERDDERGGIYIYTGGDASSTGNGYGDGWLRAASVEFWENEGSKYNKPEYSENSESSEYSTPKGFQVNCAVKIHGNASRMAEKTPKHSFRMKMKSDYGPKKLHYRLFGKGGGKKFNQIVIRAGFGNTWLHWLTGQQKQAMFTRDAWAKRMMREMGHLSAGTRYAHLYINGLYWGMYNPTERIDEDFCELHLGGEPEDYDVVRFDDGKLNTVDGELDAYQRMYETVKQCSNYATYQSLRGLDVKGDSLPDGEVLFDPDNFIDFMLVNYYGGNGDWDHHNWVAVRSRMGGEGFRWLPWDSELVLQGVNDNVTNVYNSKCPTAIFKKLMDGSAAFKMNFVDRAYQALCEPFGRLTPDSAQAVWEDLTQEIDAAIWAEQARWGDYRRDVHPYTSRGELYTKLTHFDKQCQKMRKEYFPKRTNIVLSQLQKAGFWSKVTTAPQLYIDGHPLDVQAAIVESSQDLTFNSEATIYYTTDGSDPIYFNTSGTVKRNTASTKYSKAFKAEHSCTIKARTYKSGEGWGPLLERNLTVLNEDGIVPVPVTVADDRYYDLQGRVVTRPAKGGIYIHHGRKVVVK